MGYNRVIVSGGRDFTDRDVVCGVMADVAREFAPMVVVHGGAKGVDRLAGLWADRRGHQVEVWRAEWTEYGPGAGPIRNHFMVEAGAVVAVIFPGGKGTADLARRAGRAGIPLRLVDVGKYT